MKKIIPIGCKDFSILRRKYEYGLIIGLIQTIIIEPKL